MKDYMSTEERMKFSKSKFKFDKIYEYSPFLMILYFIYIILNSIFFNN